MLEHDDALLIPSMLDDLLVPRVGEMHSNASGCPWTVTRVALSNGIFCAVELHYGEWLKSYSRREWVSLIQERNLMYVRTV